MAAKSIKLDLDLNTKDAQRAVKDLNRELSNSETSMEDAESAGKQMARAIEQASSDTITEIEATKRAVDALELALDGFDADPQQVVGDLKRMGLTADEIAVDADELAAAIRSIDDVKISARDAGFDDLNKVMGETEATGRASSVAIGGIGNSISELPGIGALGPLAESVGQLAETALEGEANVGQLGKALGVMGGTAAVMIVVGKAMDSIAATKAFNDEQAQSFADAIDDVGEGVKAVNATLEETDKIVGRAGGTFGAFEKEIDITPSLRDAEVSYDQWLDAVANGGPALDLVTDKLKAHRDAMEDARDAALRNGETTVGYEQAISDANNAIEIAGETHKNYSTTLENTAENEEWRAESTIQSTEAQEAATEATDRRIESLEGEADALSEATDALETQLDAQMAAADASYALERAQFDLTDAVTEANEVFASAEKGSRAYREAELSVIDAANGVAQAEIRKAEETAAASGKVLTAKDRIDAMNGSLITQASQLNGPSRQALLDHIGEVNNVPASKMTEIQAAINAGDLSTAETLLNGASRTRTTAVDVDLNRDQEADVERRLNNLARWRGTGIDIHTDVRGRGSSHTGSRFEAGEAKVVIPGEQLFVADGPGRMYSPAESQRMLGGGSTTSVVVNVTGTPDIARDAGRALEAALWKAGAS